MNQKFESGDRIVFYNLQPIPRKDGKLCWVDDRPLCIYGYKKVHATVRSHSAHNDRLWITPDDRPYEMTLKNLAKCGIAFEEEAEGSAPYIYLQDIDKGHPLYFGGGCIPSLADKTTVVEE